MELRFNQNRSPNLPGFFAGLFPGFVPMTNGLGSPVPAGHSMTMPHRPDNTPMTWAICLFLAVVTLFVYWGVFSSEFTGYDDPYYVTLNQPVRDGLTWQGVGWAFTTRFCENWHPLTWLSLMLDSSVYGLDPLGFHATNLGLHILNTILLFLLLQRITGASWRSAFVAALFALHPLHVESVAWVAERKDVLSTFFFLLTLMAYVRYAQKQSRVEGRGSSAESSGLAVGSRLWSLDYLIVLFFFALGLMAKPMLVTLPFLLLLLDFWPLRRMPPVLKIFGRELQLAKAEPQTPFRQSSLGWLVWEKAPLLALSAISSAVTIWAQTYAFVLTIAFKDRWLNAAWSYLRYLVEAVWPARLYINYPYLHNWPAGYSVIAIFIIGTLSVVAIREARRRPYVFMGWFWFLGILVPVIGLVQVGTQSVADRYTYVPLVGLFIVVAWLGCDLAQRWRFPPALLGALAVLVVAACVPVTVAQVGYWKNSFVLSEHALGLNPDNVPV
jgi:hypothetical protein